MPTTTWIDVASDAVKIGLGSLVGGIFAYLMAGRNHRLQQRGEYAKRRRDSIESIAASFDEEALAVVDRTIAIASLPFGGDDEAMFERLLKIAKGEPSECILISYKFHALEARLALLSLPHIAEAVEKFRELATEISLIEPHFKDSEDRFTEATSNILKQRTLVTTMMAMAYKDE